MVACDAGNSTLIPLPEGTGRVAGLLTIGLPAGIRKSQSFHVVVRQLHDRKVLIPKRRPTQVETAAGATLESSTLSTGEGRIAVVWREVAGTFQVTMPISTKEALLLSEERLLAWLKWKLTVLPSAHRWYPILVRYAEQVGGRIKGFGGDPGRIQPSATGAVPGFGPPRHGEPGHHGRKGIVVGKVSAVRFDRFGDFVGFCLLDEEGHEHSFRSVEPKTHELITYAWSDRTLIAVRTTEGDPHWPVEISLLRP